MFQFAAAAARRFGFIFLFLVGRWASAQVLTQGPVFGGVTDVSANVFVRTDVVATVVLQYTSDPTFTTWSETPSYKTTAASDFTRIIPLSGLLAGTRYYINVIVNGTPQFALPYPSFTSFPTAGASRNFKFIVLTDFGTVYQLTENTPTYSHVAAEAPAFVFLGGDFDHRNPVTLDDKRTMLRQLFDSTSPFLKDFVEKVLWRYPIAHQWDDHDSGLNNLDKTYPDWLLNQQAYEEYVPAYPLPSVKPGIWQKFSCAQMEGFILDCRSQRDPDDDVDDANKSILDGNNLGRKGQLQWLEGGLLASTAVWKVIFTSVVTNTTTKYPDGWAGFQTEFSALRDFINQNNITNVVFISGDLHLAAIDNGSIAGFPEMCVPVPGGEEEVGHCATGALGTWSEGYYKASCYGYGRVTVQQHPDRLTLEDADQSGKTVLSYTVNDQRSGSTGK